MADNGKMTALKESAKNLLATLKLAERTSGDIKVAIIPFNAFVKVPASYQTNSWFNFDHGLSLSKWAGCVEDRDFPNDVRDTTPTNTATYFPAIKCGTADYPIGNPVAMLPLTSDWLALNNKVTDMQPDGVTNITIGLAWAWHALTANAPLTEASDPKPDLEKVIVLMTDGQNTYNRQSGLQLTNPSEIDARTKLVCENIKAANIKLYTIRVIEGNADLLRGCASDPGMYYDVQNASQLNGVFTAIATKLSKLYIAK
jgi:von Willebrand factor type A domain